MADIKDEYVTLRAPARIETKVQASRFIADAVPVGDRGNIESMLGQVQKEFFDATHHCYAYRLGTDGRVFRMHDDGEPSGSAGKPILAAIDRAGVTDCLVVVTRYFGGTKLGVGGLVRAYGGAADGVLAVAPRLTRNVVKVLEISFPHSVVSPVMHTIGTFSAHVTHTWYDEDVHIRLEIRISRTEEFRLTLIGQTGGRVMIQAI